MRKSNNKIMSLILSGVLAITTLGFINRPVVNNTVKADEIKETVSVLSDLKVVDYSAYTGKYMVYFNEAEQSNGYNIYVDTKDAPVKTVKKSGEYISAEELSKFTQGTHTMYVSNTDHTGNESLMISTKFEISGQLGNNTEIPQIYIYTNKSISNEYHEKADVTVSVFDKDGGSYKPLTDSGCNIKIRGNTTAGAPKKPWNIKLSSKQKVLGMDKGKKWCLLANSFDKSLMRNSLAYDFGLNNGVTYTSQSRFADVYINGKYNGNYLITEAVEAKKERVDIDAYNGESNDILLELGTRNEVGVDHFTTSVLRTTYDVNDPEKGDDLTDAQVDAKISRVKTYLDEFERALINNNYDEILKYIDEDTFINFYIVNELFKNVDFNFSSTRFYIKDNKIYAGPLWDFDLSSGNCKSSYYRDYYVDGVSYKGFYCQSMNWYKRLLKNEIFCNHLTERYKKLQYNIQSIYRTDSSETVSINYLLDNFGQSFARNYLPKDQLGAGWELTNDDGYSFAAESGWRQWKEPVEFLRSWLQNRNQWMCEQWNIDATKAYEDTKPVPETTTPEPTTQKPTTETPTTALTTEQKTTVENKTTTKKIKVGKAKVKSAVKKNKSAKIKLTFVKVKGATGYQIKISTSKKFKKNNTVTRFTKKIKLSVNVRKFKKSKKLYVKVRGYKVYKNRKIYGLWSNKKTIQCKNKVRRK